MSRVKLEILYGWFGQFPQLREWLGPRHVHSLKAHSFTILNRTFESTVAVKRDDISDDKLGVFKPTFSEMGHLARNHPEELVFSLLAAGFDTTCYDGQNFFDDEHPQLDTDSNEVLISNMDAGSETPWYLLDTARAVKPLIWQERETYDFQAVTSHNDPHVFMNDEYLFGVRARVNAGLGLWQLAHGSRATLDQASYAAARAKMMNFRAENGRILGVRPTTLVVPPDLEDAALRILNTETGPGGASNPWQNTADLIVTPFVAG